MRLSMLDRSRTRSGEPDSEAINRTVRRAVHAEAAGYDRFWVAEHHAVPGIASGSPAVLLAAVGARTSTIRLGSGGVMLPLHQPLVVAEQFLVLEALHPGRVDLGLGRSLGFTPPVRRALGRDLDARDGFEADLRELRSYLDRSAAVTARPVVPSPVPMHVLATGSGVQVAAELGLPVVVGGPVLESSDLPDVLASYRRRFRPYADSRPWVVVSTDVLVADDDRAALELALPEAWAQAQARQTGSFPPLESPAAIRAASWSGQVRRRVEQSLERAVAGSVETVRRRLEELADRSTADELMASGSTFDVEAQQASDRLLRGLVD